MNYHLAINYTKLSLQFVLCESDKQRLRQTVCEQKYVCTRQVCSYTRVEGVGMTAAQSLQNNIVSKHTSLFYSPSAGNNTRFSCHTLQPHVEYRNRIFLLPVRIGNLDRDFKPVLKKNHSCKFKI